MTYQQVAKLVIALSFRFHSEEIDYCVDNAYDEKQVPGEKDH